MAGTVGIEAADLFIGTSGNILTTVLHIFNNMSVILFDR